MKKTLIFSLLVLFATAGTLSAQGFSLRSSDQGYRGMFATDLSIEADGNMPTQGFGIYTTHGYKFNSHFYLGAGLGLRFSDELYDEFGYHAVDDFTLTAIPIFINGRFSFISHRVTPFIDLKEGVYIYPDHEYTGYMGKTYTVDGFVGYFSNVSFGVHFGFSDRFALNLLTGLEVDITGFKESYYGDSNDNYGIGLLMAIEFEF